MSFLDLKAESRRRVHDAFAVPCTFVNSDGRFDTTARLHGRMVIGGDLNGEGFSTIIEGVFRVIFNRELLSALNNNQGVRPGRGDRVFFTDYFGTGLDAAVELDARDALDGPVDEKWSVAGINTAPTAYGRSQGAGTSAGASS